MTGSNLSWTLALGNIRRERKFFVPYILASTGIVMMFYLLVYIWKDPGLKKISTGETLSALMGFGTVVVGVFAAIFLLYINNFLMKRRNKELGIYNILGMEKRHIGRILQMESLITSVISITAGILLGVVFSKLVQMIILKILGAPDQLTGTVNLQGVLYSVIFFSVLFELIQLRNRFRVQFSRPIELLKGSDSGEREPKGNIFLALTGAAFLVAGYTLALRVDDVLSGISFFFIAVILVIVGTYLLFTSVSVVVLKLLQKSTNYYYKPGHFTSVSGMLFRMKQNAVGMANICILATMVLVIISTTVCLNTGIDKTIQNLTPMKASLSGTMSGISKENGLKLISPASQSEVRQLAKKTAEEKNSRIQDMMVYTAYCPQVRYHSKKNTISYHLRYSTKSYTGSLMIIDEQQYKAITGKDLHLSGREVLAHTPSRANQVRINGKAFKARCTTENFLPTTASRTQGGAIVVKDRNVIQRIAAQDPAPTCTLYRAVTFTASGSEAVNRSIGNSLNTQLNREMQSYASKAKHAEGPSFFGSCSTYTEIHSMLKGFTNGFLFLGIFLGLLFTLAAALIIYYKQVSEGYYDKNNFAIMQQVGMSNAEVKRSIRSQVMFVFFTPIIVAACHMSGAFNMMNHILQLFGLQDTWLFLKCSGITFLLFTLLYLIVYLVTSREYYKIVSWKAGERLD